MAQGKSAYHVHNFQSFTHHLFQTGILFSNLKDLSSQAAHTKLLLQINRKNKKSVHIIHMLTGYDALCMTEYVVVHCMFTMNWLPAFLI